MKPGDTIETGRLLLRHWNKRLDGAAFHRLNSDPAVMRFFPVRRSRRESDELLDLVAARIASDGYGWSAITLRSTGEVIGFGGLSAIAPDFPCGPGTEIGWRLLPHHWGNGYATEAARAYADYGFNVLGLSEILSFAVSGNHASTAVMKRIGMIADPSGDFDHPRITDEHPTLKRHVLYRLARPDMTTP